MSDCMDFPITVEEFMEQYKVIDTDGIYMSKGCALVPIFRMKQWFEHLQKPGDDTIYRQAAINAIENTDCELPPNAWDELTDAIMSVPPAQQWIPASEKLPDKEGNYLVTVLPTYNIRIARWIGRWVGYIEPEILAWMPLPEPARLEGE